MVRKKLKSIKKAIEVLMTPKLNAVKFGLAGGIVTGLCVALTTLVGILGFMGGFTMWNSLIVDIYGILGYSVSGTGLVLGAIYGFVDGFVGTWIFALIYNKLL